MATAAWARATYPTAPDVVRVGCRLLPVQFVHLLQLARVHLRLLLLIGKAPHSFHGADGLLGGAAGSGQGVLNLFGEPLRAGVGTRRRGTLNRQSHYVPEPPGLSALWAFLPLLGNSSRQGVPGTEGWDLAPLPSPSLSLT